MKSIAAALLILAFAPAPRARATPVGNLPLVEVPSSKDSDTMAVLWSGDGGWLFVEDGVSKALAAQGIPVVGFNSLKYFWNKRTPEEAAKDLVTVIDAYSKRWARKKVILIGYSFGADVQSFIVQKLPKDVTAGVPLVVFLAPWHNADFEFHFSGWWSDPKRSDSLSVLDGIASLKGIRLLCLYGRDDVNASCKETNPKSVAIVPMQGGHTFAGDYSLVADEILKALSAVPAK